MRTQITKRMMILIKSRTIWKVFIPSDRPVIASDDATSPKENIREKERVTVMR